MNLPSSSKREWSLTAKAFDQLLLTFDADRDAGARKYEIMRRKLIEFFEARGTETSPDLTDETINRVARRIAEGEQIQDLKAYFYGVARLVWLENLRARNKVPAPLELSPTPIAANTAELEVERLDREARLSCLETCLAQLSSTNRSLIIEYYREEKGLKIEHRKRQAEQMKTTLNGLRLRASRIKSVLTQCVHACVGQGRPT